MGARPRCESTQEREESLRRRQAQRQSAVESTVSRMNTGSVARCEPSANARPFTAWALATQPLLPRDTFDASEFDEADEWLRRYQESAIWGERIDAARLVVGWYSRKFWSDSGLVRQAERLAETVYRFEPTAREMLAGLGELGHRVLSQWPPPDRDLPTRRHNWRYGTARERR